MAKRRSKQDVDAKQDALPFDYSQAEWSKIEAAARAVLPDVPLPNELRKALVDYAQIYRIAVRVQVGAKLRRDLRKIARLSERYHQVLSIIIEELVPYCSALPEGKKVRRFFEETLEHVVSTKYVALSLADNVAQARVDAGGVLYGPRRTYQGRVLEIWTLLGGQLRFSRHPRTGRLQGPLIRFFRAVTSPVMGASAPALESLPDIVRRQKEFAR